MQDIPKRVRSFDRSISWWPMASGFFRFCHAHCCTGGACSLVLWDVETENMQDMDGFLSHRGSPKMDGWFHGKSYWNGWWLGFPFRHDGVPPVIIHFERRWTISWGKWCEQSTGFVALPEVPYVQTHPKTWEIWNVYVFAHVRELIGIYCIYIYIHDGDEGYLQREGYLQKI